MVSAGHVRLLSGHGKTKGKNTMNGGTEKCANATWPARDFPD
jgi:hypothetical protein